MGDTFRLGRIAGVDVGFHWSLLFIAAVIVFQVTGQVAADGVAAFALGVLGALLFLGSILLHELGHSVVARHEGLEVDGISLVFFGGVARLRGEPQTPGAEFRIAGAGPAASGMLAALFWGAGVGLDGLSPGSSLADVLLWLGLLNLILFVFNLLPASPLDGGRILKAALWRWWGDQSRAAIGAGRAGQVLGWALVALGVWQIRESGPLGLWTAMIGWLIIAGAGAEVQHARQRQRRRQLGDLPDVVPGLPWPPPHDRAPHRDP